MVLGVVFLVGAFAIPVMAHGPGRGPGAKGNWGGSPGYYWDDGRASSALTAEQQSKLGKLSRNFYDETAQARDALWSKMGELNRLFNSEKPDAEKAKTLQKEISDLRAKMAQARIDLELEERKIAPQGSNRRGYGRGYGPGMRGSGPGMRGGYGPGMGYYGHHMGGNGPGMRGPGWHHRGGYGPEACWR